MLSLDAAYRSTYMHAAAQDHVSAIPCHPSGLFGRNHGQMSIVLSAGMGRVNCAFLRSLQQPDACSPGKTVFSQLEACLEAACAHASGGTSSPRIVVVGHSLGGGIAFVLAQLLFAR